MQMQIQIQIQIYACWSHSTLLTDDCIAAPAALAVSVLIIKNIVLPRHNRQYWVNISVAVLSTSVTNYACSIRLLYWHSTSSPPFGPKLANISTGFTTHTHTGQQQCRAHIYFWQIYCNKQWKMRIWPTNESSRKSKVLSSIYVQYTHAQVH